MTRWHEFRGVIAPVITPFDPDGNVYLEAVPQYVDFLVEGGIAALMVGGSTGEFIALELSERKGIAETFVAATAGRIPVIVHVGHVGVEQAVLLAKHAAGIGADAVTAISPYFYPVSQGAIQQGMDEIIRAIPETPFFTYSYPAATGNDLAFTTFTNLREDHPSLVGAKLSVSSMDDVEPYLRLLDRACVATGNDALMHDAVKVGVGAVVSGNAAVFPEMVTRIHGNMLKDPYECHAEGLLLQRIAQITRGGSPDRLHDLLVHRGVDVGRSRIRTFSGSDEVRLDQDIRVRELWTLIANQGSLQN